MIFQGIWTSIAKKPYIFVIFQGEGGGSEPPDPPPPLDSHMTFDPRLNIEFQSKNLMRHGGCASWSEFLMVYMPSYTVNWIPILRHKQSKYGPSNNLMNNLVKRTFQKLRELA